MATSYQRRPGDKLPSGPARPGAELNAELQKAEAQRRALEQRGGDRDADAELINKMQPSLGNSAVQAMLNRGTQTRSDTSAGESALDEQRAEEEEQEKDEDKDAGEVQQVLPSFSTGGGGGSGAPPWSMGRMFGGEDDGEGDVAAVDPTGWRPMPVLPDPDDEEVPLGDADPDDPDAPLLVDLREARAALGEVSWRPTPLSRGMRDPRRLARVAFGPEALVDADGLDHALGRLRAGLRFVAAHGDGAPAVTLARAATVAGEAAFPTAAGFSGATARAAAMMEATLALLPRRWERVLEVALDPRARARAEHAAAALATTGRLSAPALFVHAGGRDVEPVDAEITLDAHPAALAALERACVPAPLPLVDVWEAPEPAPVADDEVDAIDALLARFTEGGPAEPGIDPEAMRPLLDAMSEMVGALGGMQVEAVAAALAVRRYVPPGPLLGLLGFVDGELRRIARRLVRVGEATEALLGTNDHAAVRACSLEATAVRSSAELLRAGALGAMARMLYAGEPVAADPPSRAESLMLRGRTAEARALLLAEGEGLVAGAMLVRMGFGEDAAPFLATDELGDAGLAARSMEAGLHLSRERWRDARAVAAVQFRRARDRGRVYALADAAITLATVEVALGGDWRAPLVAAARSLKRRKACGALNLLVARWGEIRRG
jgi:hypothetical protein